MDDMRAGSEDLLAKGFSDADKIQATQLVLLAADEAPAVHGGIVGHRGVFASRVNMER